MKLEEQNILFFSRSTQHGGTENVILQLCEIFKDRVNKIVVCSADGFDVKKLAKMGIKHYVLPDIESKKPSTLLKVYNELKIIVKAERITIIHTHHRMAAFYVTFLRLYKKCYFLNTSHNTFTNHISLTRYAFKHAHLIACGEMVKKNLTDVFAFKDVTVIHNAVKPFDGEITEEPLIKELHSKGNFVIANVGRLSKQKGMEFYIEAIPNVIKMHPEARFLIVGSGEDKEKLKALSKEIDVDEFLIFMGYRKDIQNLLSQVDLVVLSSLWEGLPLTPIEAFSVGKTIVATAMDGTIEIVEDKKNGLLVDSKNSKQLSEKICWMIENDKSSMEQEAMNTFENKFSFQTLARNYINAYVKYER